MPTNKSPFEEASIAADRTHATITVPISVASMLVKASKREKLFCSIVDGVLQISSGQPTQVISALKLKTNYFER